VSLLKYIKKRTFTKTPEPAGKHRHVKKGKKLTFVIHEHHASHLHFDFRLEMDGVLKSWSVPKGPSLDPTVKRLAVEVEDHPFEYGKFHGVIPAGNYGAGSVYIWDKGTYESVHTDDPKESEKILLRELKKGHLKFVMNGKKLKGEFALIRTGIPGPKNNWLLVKKSDKYAGKWVDVQPIEKPQSKTSKLFAKPRNVQAAGAARSENPGFIKPMLATLVKEPFDRKGWIFEVKWDGYRALAYTGKEGVKLLSRHDISYNEDFAPIAESMGKIGFDAVFDGEIVVVDEKGRSDFQLLQQFQKTGKVNIVYYIFDLLFYKGKDLRSMPLLERKKLLKKVLPKLPRVRLSEYIVEKGKAFFEAADQNQLEGVMGKNGLSTYHAGLRTSDWVKVKTYQRQEAVICGFTAPRKSRTSFGALVMGVYEGNDLVYVGHTGGGFDDKKLRDVKKVLEKYVTKECPFKVQPKTNAPVQWVKPKLVCEIRFANWTQDGIMREPIFLGMRDDKNPQEVKREKAQPVEKAVLKSGKKVSGLQHSATSGLKKIQAFTHLDKVFWKKEGYTKGDVIHYYKEISSFILPYLKDRPEILHRHPHGPDGESFYQKNITEAPIGIRTEKVFSPHEEKFINYLICNDRDTLLYLANLGCIEINPWNSRIQHLDKPDYMVLDLDPLDIGFDKVVETALGIYKILDSVDVESFCKTSGATGLHIYVPLGGKYTTEQTVQFAHIVMEIARQQMLSFTSTERVPAKRKKCVYLDFLQNRQGQSLAAVYSLRPKPKAPVATPLLWSEVKNLKDPTVFNIETIFKRLDKKGDLWKGVLGKGIDMAATLKKLEKKYKSV